MERVSATEQMIKRYKRDLYQQKVPKTISELADEAFPSWRSNANYASMSDADLKALIVKTIYRQSLASLTAKADIEGKEFNKPDDSLWNQYSAEEILEMYYDGISNVPQEFVEWALSVVSEDSAFYEIDENPVFSERELSELDNVGKSAYEQRKILQKYSSKTEAQEKLIENKSSNLNKINSNIKAEQENIIDKQNETNEKIKFFEKRSQGLEEKISRGEQLSDNELSRYEQMTNYLTEVNKDLVSEAGYFEADIEALFESVKDTETLIKTTQQMGEAMSFLSRSYGPNEVGIQLKYTKGNNTAFGKLEEYKVAARSQNIAQNALDDAYLIRNNLDITEMNQRIKEQLKSESANIVYNVESEKPADRQDFLAENNVNSDEDVSKDTEQEVEDNLEQENIAETNYPEDVESKDEEEIIATASSEEESQLSEIPLESEDNNLQSTIISAETVDENNATPPEENNNNNQETQVQLQQNYTENLNGLVMPETLPVVDKNELPNEENQKEEPSSTNSVADRDFMEQDILFDNTVKENEFSAETRNEDEESSSQARNVNFADINPEEILPVNSNPEDKLNMQPEEELEISSENLIGDTLNPEEYDMLQSADTIPKFKTSSMNEEFFIGEQEDFDFGLNNPETENAGNLTENNSDNKEITENVINQPEFEDAKLPQNSAKLQPVSEADKDSQVAEEDFETQIVANKEDTKTLQKNETVIHERNEETENRGIQQNELDDEAEFLQKELQDIQNFAEERNNTAEKIPVLENAQTASETEAEIVEPDAVQELIDGDANSVVIPVTVQKEFVNSGNITAADTNEDSLITNQETPDNLQIRSEEIISRLKSIENESYTSNSRIEFNSFDIQNAGEKTEPISVSLQQETQINPDNAAITASENAVEEEQLNEISMEKAMQVASNITLQASTTEAGKNGLLSYAEKQEKKDDEDDTNRKIFVRFERNKQNKMKNKVQKVNRAAKLIG